MMSSRGMGDISPSKMPKGKKKARRDDTDFTQYAEGGKVKSKVSSKLRQSLARALGNGRPEKRK